jgi:hypothetical protein
VLAFPIMITLLMLLVSASTKVLDGGDIGAILAEIQGLIAYAVVMITASVLLFKFVWEN